VVEPEATHRTDEPGLCKAGSSRPVCLGVNHRAESLGDSLSETCPGAARRSTSRATFLKSGKTAPLRGQLLRNVGLACSRDPARFASKAVPLREDRPTLSAIFCPGNPCCRLWVYESVHSKALTLKLRLARELRYRHSTIPGISEVCTWLILDRKQL